jgi:hypothetical protein
LGVLLRSLSVWRTTVVHYEYSAVGPASPSPNIYDSTSCYHASSALVSSSHLRFHSPSAHASATAVFLTSMRFDLLSASLNLSDSHSSLMLYRELHLLATRTEESHGAVQPGAAVCQSQIVIHDRTAALLHHADGISTASVCCSKGRSRLSWPVSDATRVCGASERDVI